MTKKLFNIIVFSILFSNTIIAHKVKNKTSYNQELETKNYYRLTLGMLILLESMFNGSIVYKLYNKNSHTELKEIGIYNYINLNYNIPNNFSQNIINQKMKHRTIYFILYGFLSYKILKPWIFKYFKKIKNIKKFNFLNFKTIILI